MNNASDVKDANLAEILKNVRKNAAVSQSALSNDLGLTIVTVNKLMTYLCENGVCTEVGKTESKSASGGRKAALYALNPDFAFIFGAVILRSGVHFTVCDFRLSVVFEENVEADISDPVSVCAILTKTLLSYKEKYGKSTKILGVGVAIPGRCAEDGTVTDIPDFPKWNKTPLGKILSDALSLPVYVDNDANTAALCAANAGEYDHFVYLKIDEGLGAGIAENGQIARGSSRRGCEIGHATLVPRGDLCKCGRHGCAQAYVSTDAVVRHVEKMSGQKTDVSGVIRGCENGDPVACDAIERFTYYLKILLHNVAFTFDTEAILIENVFLEKIPEIGKRLTEIGDEDERAPKIVVCSDNCLPASIPLERFTASPTQFIENK